MNKKWTWSKIVLATAAGLLAVLMLSAGSLSIADHKGKPHGKPGGGGEDPPPPPAELPDVRYRIQFVQFPANANGGPFFVNDINNWGQAVGKYSAEDGQRMFLYDPLRSADQAIDMNAIVTAGLPDGWRLRSALAINDHMVVVGNMEEVSTGQRRPIAIDLFTQEPVVDLLSDLGVESHGVGINENGDILGMNPGSWIFTPDLNGEHDLSGNPHLYGDPAQRILPDGTPLVRDGTPLNMSSEIFVPLPLSGEAVSFELNNPVGNSPTQIAGSDPDGNVFRFTLGDAEPEWFPEVNLAYPLDGITGLNDSGTLCGVYRGPKIKGKSSVDPFRFNPIFEPRLELLPMDVREHVIGMNSSGDLITGEHVYHDDWGWVKIDDLVVGTDTDLQAWSGLPVFTRKINDRAGEIDAGQITGGFTGVLWVLTPEFP